LNSRTVSPARQTCIMYLSCLISWASSADDLGFSLKPH
jgi:hypothetical protein